jgi:hypothetical protein
LGDKVRLLGYNLESGFRPGHDTQRAAIGRLPMGKTSEETLVGLYLASTGERLEAGEEGAWPGSSVLLARIAVAQSDSFQGRRVL